MNWFLSQFDPSSERARRKYQGFVAQGKGVEIWGELKGGVILGGEGFAGRLAPLLRERKLQREIPRRERLSARPSLEEVFAGVEGRIERDARIFQAVVEYGYRLAEVGDHLGLHYSTVSRIVSRQKSKVKT